MRKLAVVLGAATGGYFGWVLGDSIDALMRSFDATQPLGHGRAIMFGIATAVFCGYAFYRAAIGFGGRRNGGRSSQLESRLVVEPTVLQPRPKGVSGRTPPAPTPAYQA